MSAYKVVITPVLDDEEATGGHAQVIIRVETAGSMPRITEMTVRSAALTGLSTCELPQIDLEAIVRALASGVRKVEPDVAADTPGGKHGVPDTPRQRQAPASGSDDTPGGPDQSVQTALALPDLPEPESTTTVHKSPDPVAPTSSTGRVYRRMPDMTEVLAVYERVGTVTGLAAHYGVPRHTAQGWMGRVRKRSG